MITLDTVLAFALRDPSVMDELGAALHQPLVVANPYQRTIAEFAHGFFAKRHKLPASGDLELWLESLPEGMQRDGCREVLGRLLAVDVRGFDPIFFAEQALPQLRKGAAQVARARINEIGSDVSPETFAMLAEQIAAIGVRETEDEFPRLDDLLQDSSLIAEPEELIRRLAWRGCLTVLSGAPKCGKSTLVAQGCAAYTCGFPFLDHQPIAAGRSGRILWIGLDEGLKLTTRRFRALRPRRSAMIRLYRGRHLGHPLHGHDLLRSIQRRVEEFRPDIVVIDSLIAYARRVTREMPKSGDAAAWAEVMRPLGEDVAQAFDVAVVVLHHAAKTGGYRDSGEIKAAANVMIEMDRAAGDPLEVRRFRCESHLSGHNETWTAYLSASGRYVFGGPPTDGGSEDMEALSPALQATLDALPADGAKWAAWLKEAGVPRNTFPKHLKALKNRGRVVQDPDKRWHRPAATEPHSAGGGRPVPDASGAILVPNGT